MNRLYICEREAKWNGEKKLMRLLRIETWKREEERILQGCLGSGFQRMDHQWHDYEGRKMKARAVTFEFYKIITIRQDSSFNTCGWKPAILALIKKIGEKSTLNCVLTSYESLNVFSKSLILGVVRKPFAINVCKCLRIKGRGIGKLKMYILCQGLLWELTISGDNLFIWCKWTC